jgi:hypothetical protein
MDYLAGFVCHPVCFLAGQIDAELIDEALVGVVQVLEAQAVIAPRQLFVHVVAVVADAQEHATIGGTKRGANDSALWALRVSHRHSSSK